MSLYYVVDCINFAYKLVLHGPIFYTYYKLVDCQLFSGFYYIMETKLCYEYIFSRFNCLILVLSFGCFCVNLTGSG